MQRVGPGGWGGGAQRIPEGMSHSKLAATANWLPLACCWRCTGWGGSGSPGLPPTIQAAGSRETWNYLSGLCPLPLLHREAGDSGGQLVVSMKVSLEGQGG